MAADFITINRTDATAVNAEEFWNFVHVLTDAYNRGTRILGKMNHSFNSGPPADFAQLEALFGISQGKGLPVFTMVNGAMGAMNGVFQNNATVELIERVG